MTLIDYANIGAGVYKGYMNAAGVDVDPAYLGYLVAGSSAISGVYRAIGATRHNVLITGRKGNKLDDILHNSATKFALGENEFMGEAKPAVEGAKAAGLRAVISAVEIAVGYGIGYAAQKILN